MFEKGIVVFILVVLGAALFAASRFPKSRDMARERTPVLPVLGLIILGIVALALVLNP